MYCVVLISFGLRPSALVNWCLCCVEVMWHRRGHWHPALHPQGVRPLRARKHMFSQGEVNLSSTSANECGNIPHLTWQLLKEELQTCLSLPSCGHVIYQRLLGSQTRLYLFVCWQSDLMFNILHHTSPPAVQEFTSLTHVFVMCVSVYQFIETVNQSKS